MYKILDLWNWVWVTPATLCLNESIWLKTTFSNSSLYIWVFFFIIHPNLIYLHHAEYKNSCSFYWLGSLYFNVVFACQLLERHSSVYGEPKVLYSGDNCFVSNNHLFCHGTLFLWIERAD